MRSRLTEGSCATSEERFWNYKAVLRQRFSLQCVHAIVVCFLNQCRLGEMMMRNFLKRHGVLVAAIAGLIAYFSSLAIETSQRSQADVVAWDDSNSQNLTPMRFVIESANVARKVGLPVAEGDIFEAPVRLKVGEQYLNNAARQMYPSPAMFDIDRDGQLELVVGDIFGSLNVYENLSDEKLDPVWSSHIPLKLNDGAKVKVSNW